MTELDRGLKNYNGVNALPPILDLVQFTFRAMNARSFFK